MGQFVPNLQKKALLTFTTKEHLMEMTEILLCQSDLYFSQVPEWLRWALSLMESLIWKIAEMFINCNSVPDVFRRPKCQPVLLLSLLAPLTFWQQLNRSHTWTDWQVSLFWGNSQLETSIFSIFTLGIKKRMQLELKDKNKHLNKPLGVSCAQTWITYRSSLTSSVVWYNGLMITDLFSLKSLEDPTAY